jgi:hypothetical protein
MATAISVPGGQRRGFLLRHGRFTFIDVPGALGTDADGINNEGDIVGGYDGPDGKHHAYVLIRREHDEE